MGLLGSRSRWAALLFAVSILTAVSHGQTLVTAAVGDLNGDGKPDVVAWNGTTLSVLLNDGAGNLTAAHFLAISAPAQSISLADFNNDGHLDILVSEHTSLGALIYEILYGDGAGAFSTPVTVPLPGNATTSPAVGDFNGDGFPDLAFGAVLTTDITILPGNGHGGFLAPVTFKINAVDLGPGAFVDTVVAVDVNHDGKPDLLIEPGCFLAVNNGNGFTSTPLIDPVFVGTSCSSTSDFNSDGNVDILGEFRIFFGDGQGGLLYSQPRINSSKVATGIPTDFDHNGTADFLQPRTTSGIQYFPGNGHGGFGDPIAVSPSNVNVIAIADLNGDGFPDLIVQDLNNPANISVILNPGVTPVSIATASQTQISASAATASTAAPVTLIALISSLNAGSPQSAGTVTFTDGTTTLGSAPVNVYGIAALDFTFTAGAHSVLNAGFGGALDTTTNTQFAASTSTSPAAVGVNATAPAGAVPNITLTTSLTPQRELNPVTFTATVTPSAPTTFSPGGNVVFRADGDVMGAAPLSGTTALFTENFPNSGLHNITATYGGDGIFPPVTSATLVEDIRAFSSPRTPGSVQLTLTPPSPVAVNQIVTLTATLNGLQTPPAQFAYRVNGAFLALRPSPVQVSPQFVPSIPGSYTITAEYLGDAVVAPTTASATLVVGNPSGDFSVAFSPQSATITAGQTATFSISVTPANGLSSSVSFTCSGLPQASSCTFSPATVGPSSSPMSTTLTIATTARPSATAVIGNVDRGVRGWSLAASFAFAVVLVGSLKRRAKATRMIRISACTALMLFVSSCGGGTGSQPPTQPATGTPQGTTQVTVTATSGISHTVSINLTVN